VNQIVCGSLVLAWESERGAIGEERKRYANPDHLSKESVLRERLHGISHLLSDRTITGEEAVTALLPAIAAYGIELGHGPVTIQVDAVTIPEDASDLERV
jgi:hypothetical protein